MKIGVINMKLEIMSESTILNYQMAEILDLYLLDLKAIHNDLYHKYSISYIIDHPDKDSEFKFEKFKDQVELYHYLKNNFIDGNPDVTPSEEIKKLNIKRVNRQAEAFEFLMSNNISINTGVYFGEEEYGKKFEYVLNGSIFKSIIADGSNFENALIKTINIAQKQKSAIDKGEIIPLTEIVERTNSRSFVNFIKDVSKAIDHSLFKFNKGLGQEIDRSIKEFKDLKQIFPKKQQEI